MITKVREARNERLIRSPFHKWHLLDAMSDMNIQTAASPAAALARVSSFPDRPLLLSQLITKPAATHRTTQLCSDAEHWFVP